MDPIPANPDALFASMKPIELADRAVFERYFSQYPQTLHAYTFPSQLLWGEPHEHTWTEWRGHLLMSYSKNKQPRCMYMPIGPEPVKIILEDLPFSAGYRWSYIDQAIADKISPPLQLHWDRDMCDYVYDVPELLKLSGKKFANKRNHLVNFQKTVDADGKKCETVAMSPAFIPACMEVYEHWAAYKKPKISEEEYNEILQDWAAFKMAMQHFDELKLMGACTLIDGKLDAFSVGEFVNSYTAGLLFSKASHVYPQSLTVTIHGFLKMLPPQITHLNRAIDGGIKGLRESKEGWHPIDLAKNYSVVA